MDKIEYAKKYLKDKIINEGRIPKENFLDVSSFLNHQVDPKCIEIISEAIDKYFKDYKIDKVLTAEASGNIIAYEVAKQLKCKLVYAKKGAAVTTGDSYQRELISPTKSNKTNLVISKQYLKPKDKILIVDDFLFTGTTAYSLADMCSEAHGDIVGFGFAIEKSGFGGRKKLEKYGDVFSVVRIKYIGKNIKEIEFEKFKN